MSFLPSHDVEVSPGGEVAHRELRHGEDQDADADVDLGPMLYKFLQP
jgi:hypothetical protein